MKDYLKYGIEDFVADSFFVEWVKKPNKKTDAFWKKFIRQNPEQEDKINEAFMMVQSLTMVEEPISESKLSRLWYKINANVDIPPKRRFSGYINWVAAAVVVFCSSLAIYLYNTSNRVVFPETASQDVSEAQLLLSDGSKQILSNDDTEIEINAQSDVIVNKDTLTSLSDTKQKVKLNHVVLPYGKQTNLQLPDGTTVYINAGSRFSFPSSFKGAKREVYLEGEAMFKVAENKDKPFIVHTREMEIFVTGTEFNVSAYEDDDYTQTVLVSGSVNVSKPGIISRKIKISPGESVEINKEVGELITKEVDADLYTSWIYGYLIFRGEELGIVLKKLERYYNQRINIEDEAVLKRRFSGKLDIHKSLSEVLDDISFASKLKVQQQEENEIYYIIKP